MKIFRCSFENVSGVACACNGFTIHIYGNHHGWSIMSAAVSMMLSSASRLISIFAIACVALVMMVVVAFLFAS